MKENNNQINQQTNLCDDDATQKIVTANGKPIK